MSELRDPSLTEKEVTALKWMVICNKRHVGFLGPTVRKVGPMEEYDRLERLGYARCITYARAEKAGYWILGDGKRAIQAIGAGK